MQVKITYKLLLYFSGLIFLLGLLINLKFIYSKNCKERKKLKIVLINMIMFLCLALTTLKVKQLAKIKIKSEAGHCVHRNPRQEKKPPFKQFGKIAICMFFTKEIEKFGNLSREINENYAKKHNYDLITFKSRMSERDPTWDKLKAIQKCMAMQNKSNKKKYNYVVWIDADAFFNLQDVPLELFMDTEHKFFACDDIYNGVINGGVFIIKNDNWGRKLIKLWWRCGSFSDYRTQLYHEQSIFDSMFGRDIFGLRKFTKIYEATSFNSDPGIVCSLKKGWDQTFVVHLMANNNLKRENIISKRLRRLKNEKS